MLRLSPCLETLFSEKKDFYERFACAKKAGAEAVEFWGWTNKDLNRVQALLDENGLLLSAFCVCGTDPDFEKYRLLYREGWAALENACQESIAQAKKLHCPSLIITCGNERNDLPREAQHTNIVLALRKVAPLFEEAGITLVLEPLNTLCNHRGYYLASSYEAFGILEEVGSPNVKLLFDIYHQQISSGNLIPTIERYGDLIGHYHVADVPGRHEPGTGEINYKNVFAAIQKTGYDRFVGLEYLSLAPSETSFAATRALLD